ncbi:MAG TPA: hypothetical protein VN541_12585, partial [Tepidisphaeraceae bacterium]|nr:hypothetical protein [Tepidisphaeraceae bacterium]
MPAQRIGMFLIVGVLALLGSRSLAAQPTTRPIEISAEFLGGDAARKAIVDESVEPYFSLLQPMDMTAKTGRPIVGSTIEQQRDECRGRYADAVREFTEEEKDGIRWYLDRIVPEAAKDFPRLARTPWSFIKVSGTIEGGLPHTRGQHIILPETLVAQLVRPTATRDPEWLALANFGEMLIHEQTHVIQRKRKAEFAKFYEQVWGFQHARSIETGDWLTVHQVLDPDGVDQH